MTNQLSRFQVISGNPQLMPHKCSVCGKIEGQFIDFGLDVEFYGTVYFCFECLRDAATQFGFVEETKAKVLESNLNQLTSQFLKLKLENEALKNAMATLVSADISSQSSVGPTPAVVEEPKQVIAKSPGRQQRPAKPSNESRRTNIQPDADVDKFIKDLDI